MMTEILNAFELDAAHCSIKAFGSGLINTTWKISNGNVYILQRVNDAVFKNPVAIAQNIRLLGEYLNQEHPAYFFTQPVKTKTGGDLFFLPEHGYFRLFPFVPHSHSIDVVTTTKQAYEAAKQFGRFTRLLSHFNTTRLQATIPDFHNLSLRQQQFVTALEKGNGNRISIASGSIDRAKQHYTIVDQYEDLKKSPSFKIRVTHHDTKISNVLFDERDNGLCVIDLDTVMPGYFISDVGDMMRTYLSPVSEEEQDFSKIQVREAYFQAIVSGYLSEMQTELSQTEKINLVYAGKFMLYMQAIRFLTDFLNNDIYYGKTYENQNLNRATNQLILLQQLCEKETKLQQMVLEITSQ